MAVVGCSWASRTATGGAAFGVSHLGGCGRELCQRLSLHGAALPGGPGPAALPAVGKGPCEVAFGAGAARAKV